MDLGLHWSQDELEAVMQNGKAVGIPENMGFLETAHFDGYDDQWQKIVDMYDNDYGRNVLAVAWNKAIAQVLSIIKMRSIKVL